MPFAKINGAPNWRNLILVKGDDGEFRYRNRDVQNFQKPDNQLVLSEADLKDDHARVLTAKSPHPPANKVVYHFKERGFKPIPNVDRSYINFEIIGNLMCKDSDEAKIYENQVKQQANVKKYYSKCLYDEYIDMFGLTRHRLLKNKFNFVDRATQTFNRSKIDQEINTEPPRKISFSDYANQWIIYDAYNADYELQLKNKEKKIKLVDKNQTKIDSLPKLKEANVSNRLFLSAKIVGKMVSYKKPNNQTEKPQLLNAKKIDSPKKKETESNRLLASAKIIERMISQNTFEDILDDFRYFEDQSDAFKEREGNLLPLWKFTNSLERSLRVTSICWSPHYFDLFGVSYGSNNFFEDCKGYIIFYTLKNPSHYEFKIETNCGCMTIDFHPDHPNLVAAGLYDGNVCVYDLSNPTSLTKVKYSSSIKHGKHSDPVWQVKWQPDDADGTKNFCSISSDGRVLQWSLRKNGLNAFELVNFYKVKQKESTEEKKDEYLFESSVSGTCFDFNIRPNDLFIVGAEDGKVYEFSKNYTNQLLTEFNAHLMPIYKIKWNYFHKKVFITCSSDNTVKIWDHRYQDPIFKFSFSTSVSDIEWAPFSSSIFGLVTTDGNIYVYDISVDTSDPICIQSVYQRRKRKLTHLAFNPFHPVLIVSDERGTVLSFKLSPNLRSSPNDKKIVSITIIHKYNYELSKLMSVMALEKDVYQQPIKTSRKYYNYEEKVPKLKGHVEKEEDEEEEEKKRDSKDKRAKSAKLIKRA